MRLTLWSAGPLLLSTSVVLVGCGQDQSPTPENTPEPSFSTLDDLPTPSPLKALTTVTGTVQAGTVTGCHLMRDGASTWLLLDNVPEDLTTLEGTRVTVRGRAEPGLITTCWQGTPLLVQDLQPG